MSKDVESDPAKQTPDGQDRLEGQPEDTPTADSSVEGLDEKTVSVSLSPVEQNVLDNLRASTSRKQFVQVIVSRYLEAANPNASFQEDDDLPGNERPFNPPNLRI